MSTSLEDTCAAIADAMAQDDDPFVRSAAAAIKATLAEHAAWTGACTGGSNVHNQDDIPCSDFERTFDLALMWLLARCGLGEGATS